MLRTLFSLYVWVMWVIIFLVFVPIGMIALVFSQRAGFHVVRAMVRCGLFVARVRMVVRGEENVDWDRAHVVMANHQNLLDPFFLVLAVPHHMVGIEKRENFRIPLYGQLIRAWGNIPINRRDRQAARETIAHATDRLRAGTSIVIMPEGTRSKDGGIGPFKKGGFHLALDAGADIVPCTINGAFQVLRNKDWRLYPGTVELVWGRAIDPAAYGRDHLDALVGAVREAITANFHGAPAPLPVESSVR